MEPYKHTDNHGNLLEVRTTAEENGAKVGVYDCDGGAYCYAGPLDIDDITRAMYRACGTLPPLMLPRPDLDGFTSPGKWRPWPDSILAVCRAGNEVRVEMDIVNGGAVSRERKARGWSMEETARRAGVNTSTVSSIEAMKSGATLDVAALLAGAFGLTIGALADGPSGRDHG